jgi:hypothetical protein
MDQGNTFNLDNEINKWFGEKRTNPSLTAFDHEELKSHLKEIMNVNVADWFLKCVDLVLIFVTACFLGNGSLSY